MTSEVYALWAGALWIGADQSGQSRFNGGFGATGRRDGELAPFSNYAPCPGDSLPGVFYVSADTAYSPVGWPADYGAPVGADGAPTAYGDEMLWATMCSTSTPPLAPDHLGRPLAGLRINQSVFAYDRSPNVVFVRHDIRNESDAPMTDVSVGFRADPDWQDASENLIGYDAEASISYVYLDPIIPDFEGGGARSNSDRGKVLGLMTLETPRGLGVNGHRIMLKGATSSDPYSAYGSTIEDNRNALRGLLNDGSVQRSYPTVARPESVSPFAYTGNPVTLDGWLDGYFADSTVQNGFDVRQLISSGPFELAPGESVTYTLAYVAQFGSDLGDGLRLLKRDVATLQAQPALWRFPAES